MHTPHSHNYDLQVLAPFQLNVVVASTVTVTKARGSEDDEAADQTVGRGVDVQGYP